MGNRISVLLSKESLLAALLGSVALFTIYMAQVSSGACAVWSYEQPKMPKSLIKID